MTISRDHPGFNDASYRKRRDFIAKLGNDSSIDIKYTETERLTWWEVSQKLMKLYPRFACKAYNVSLAASKITCENIPQLSEINNTLEKKGFSIQPVSGLITPRSFLETLEKNVMLCTRYIRHHSVPEYTPEPDIIHEVLGHCVFFHDEKYRELNRAFGRAARRACDDSLLRISRIYWYTVEFGLCTENNNVKAYGAGLLSSLQELSNTNNVEIAPMRFEDIAGSSFDTMTTHSKLYLSPYTYEKTASIIIDFLESL